jgi:hypothetical protein
MKLKDILLESPTDVVARFYKEAGKDFEQFHNPEVAKYHEKNSEYYNEYFKKWFNKGVVSVFTKPVDKPQPVYTNAPKESKLQSSGYRGLQYALAAAGLPYNRNVQEYNPDPARALVSQTMDGARNANGQ